MTVDRLIEAARKELARKRRAISLAKRQMAKTHEFYGLEVRAKFSDLRVNANHNPYKEM